MKKGIIVIISGPSGSGKTTLHQKVLASKRFQRKLVKSISATTRPKRAGEKHGRDYLFISEKMFLYKKRAGHFLEAEKVFHHYYGTPYKNVRQLLNAGKNVLLCIDVKGAKVVAREYPNALRIFIKPPSMAVLKYRLEKRATEGKKDLQTRLKIAKKELLEAEKYDFMIVNDNLQAAFRELENILIKKLL